MYLNGCKKLSETSRKRFGKRLKLYWIRSFTTARICEAVAREAEAASSRFDKMNCCKSVKHVCGESVTHSMTDQHFCLISLSFCFHFTFLFSANIVKPIFGWYTLYSSLSCFASKNKRKSKWKCIQFVCLSKGLVGKKYTQWNQCLATDNQHKRRLSLWLGTRAFCYVGKLRSRMVVWVRLGLIRNGHYNMKRNFEW